MRFTPLAFLLASFAAMTLAGSSYDDLYGRDLVDEDVVFDAREALEDLGIDTRALQRASRSASRLEHLEARVESLESELAARGPPHPKSVSPPPPKASTGKIRK